MRVLIVQDDKPVASLVQKGLEAEQYAVDIAKDGVEARRMVNQLDYDLALLRLDGMDVLNYIRDTKPALPVLILTGRSGDKDWVKRFDTGADDYLTMPFPFSELSARVRALLRRTAQPAAVVLRVGELELNRVERTVRRAGQPLDLTPKEYGLLEYLMRHAGCCVTRAMISEHVWNLPLDTGTNVVDVYINYVRRKIDNGHKRSLIITIRGVGYKIDPETC